MPRSLKGLEPKVAAIGDADVSPTERSKSVSVDEGVEPFIAMPPEGTFFNLKIRFDSLQR